MPSDFDKLDKLLSLVPLSRIRCPKCGNGAKDGFELAYELTLVCPVEADGPSKILEPDYTYENLTHSGNDRLVCVKCDHTFPVPEDWTIRPNPNAKKKKNPEGEGIENGEIDGEIDIDPLTGKSVTKVKKPVSKQSKPKVQSPGYKDKYNKAYKKATDYLNDPQAKWGG